MEAGMTMEGGRYSAGFVLVASVVHRNIHPTLNPTFADPAISLDPHYLVRLLSGVTRRNGLDTEGSVRHDQRKPR